MKHVGTIFLVLLLGLSGCGGGGSSPTPPPPPPPPTNADLQITVSGPASAAPGTTIDYVVSIVNAGPAIASDATVQATITGNVTVTAITDGGTEAAGTVSWPATASLTNGQSQNFTITLSPTVEGEVRITVSGITSSNDPIPANNDGSASGASVTTTVTRSADVVVTQSGGGGFTPGEPVTLTVTIQNTGPDDAQNVIVTNNFIGTLPINAISDGGTFVGSAVTWPAISSLPAGSSVIYTVSASGPLVGPVEGRASADSPTTDPSPANNDGNSPVALARLLTTFSAIRTVSGEAAGDQFGWLMENLGDVDADGVADFAVTAPTNDQGGNNAGKVYVYSGASGSLIRSFTGTAGEQFGTSVDLAGDIDGDGIGDLIVGAPASASGRAVIFSGATGAQIRSISGPTPNEQFGFSVARAGDVNNDLVNDVIVGAPAAAGTGAGAGRAYVYSGLDGSLLHTFNPAVAGAAFGSAVGGPGDLNADGFDDLLVGAPNTAGGGRVYVLSGATGTTLYPSIAPDATGGSLGNFWLESPGDLDGDGFPDIFAADITNRAGGTNTGRAYVYSGATGGTIHVLSGEMANDQFGIGRGAVDADSDGVPDIFIAAWLNSEGATAAGKAYLYSGASGTLLRTFTSTTAGENLGFDTVGIGDVDADGIPDYLLSGGISGSTSGHVRVVKGVVVP